MEAAQANIPDANESADSVRSTAVRCREEIDRKRKRVLTERTEAAKEKIILNIGGKLFYTTRTTLLAHEGTLFYHMLSSGAWQPDDEGQYFIDRKPKYFEYIFDFLRGQLDYDQLEEVDEIAPHYLQELKREVDFYQVDKLQDVLQHNDWSFCGIPLYDCPWFSNHNRIVTNNRQLHSTFCTSSVAFSKTMRWEMLLVSVPDRSYVTFGLITKMPVPPVHPLYLRLDQQPETGWTRIDLDGQIMHFNPNGQSEMFGVFKAFDKGRLKTGDKIGFLLQTRPLDTDDAAASSSSTLTFEYRGKHSDPVPLHGAGPYYFLV